MEKKYCPNCLRECTESPYGGYACSPCGVLQYSTSILFDTPDEEKSKEYKIRELLKPYMNYAVTDEHLTELIGKLKDLLSAKEK